MNLLRRIARLRVNRSGECPSESIEDREGFRLKGIAGPNEDRVVN